MTDVQNPVPTELSTPGNPPPASTNTTNWESAYKALQTTLNTANTEKAALRAQLEQANTRIGELQAGADTLKIQLEGQLNGLKTQLTDTTTKLQSAEAQATRLAAEKAKLDALVGLETTPEVKAHLLNILPQIPTAPDAELQTQMIKSFASFGENVAKTREEQLRQGVTPGFGQGSPAPADPNDEKGWQAALASKTYGTPEYKAISDKYFQWALKQK